MKRTRSLLKRILALGVGTLVAFAGTELFTRALLPQDLDTVMGILRSDDALGFTYVPNSNAYERGRDYNVEFSINSLGLRDRELGPDHEGVFRILLLGNSFSVSHGCEIEESLSRALEQALRERLPANRPVEVVNAACVGHNSLNYYQGYRHWQPILDPDLVLVGFVPAREHICDEEDIRFVIRDGVLLARYHEGESPVIRSLGLGTTIRKTLARNSELYVLLRNFFYYNPRVDGLLNKAGWSESNLSVFDPYIVPVPERVESGWNLAFDYIRRIQAAAAADGVSFGLIGVPQRAQVEEIYLATVFPAAAKGEVDTDPMQPYSIMAEFCDERGLLFFDTHEAIVSVNDGGVAFMYDNHWSAVGIRAAAEAVAEQMKREQLPPFDTMFTAD